MLGTMIPPLYAVNGSGGGSTPPATNTTTTAFTGGAWTFTKTAEATTAEDIVTFTLSDALTSYLRLRNYDNTDASFVPELVSINAGADPALVLTTDTGADTGTQPSLFLNLFNNGGTGTTRPALKLNYQAATLLEVSGTGAWTFTKTAQASTAETIVTFKVSDDASGQLSLQNSTSTDGRFEPILASVSPDVNSRPSLQIRAGVPSARDNGSSPILIFNVRNEAASAITSRNLISFQNNSTSILDLLPLNSGANSALSWGTQAGSAPAFTTRSSGTRIVLGAAISGSLVDYAIGAFGGGTAGTWYSVPGATSGYEHRWYAGTTNVMSLSGEGKLTTTGGRVVKTRIALTTPVTVAAGTDEVVFTDLTTPGAVAVTLPANVAGQRLTIKDRKGDAGANNITITPTAGLIDGAATLVIAANYGKAEVVGDGTNWFTV